VGTGHPGDGANNNERPGGDDNVPYDRFADLPPVDVTIPDDASELDEDVHTYLRERRGGLLRRRLGRLLFTRRWNAYGLSGPLVVAILLVVALVGALASLLPPRDPPRSTPTPLSTRATAAPGRPGALLPVGRIRIAGVSLVLRDLRPAVLALVTPACGCEKELDELFNQATQYRLDLLLVHGRPGGQALAAAAELRLLAARVGNGSAQIGEDTDGALTRVYGPRELTAVLVRTDGVVTAVHRGLRDLRRLELDLARLPHLEVAH
jgi:hypothetical protein